MRLRLPAAGAAPGVGGEGLLGRSARRHRRPVDAVEPERPSPVAASLTSVDGQRGPCVILSVTQPGTRASPVRYAARGQRGPCVTLPSSAELLRGRRPQPSSAGFMRGLMRGFMRGRSGWRWPVMAVNLIRWSRRSLAGGNLENHSCPGEALLLEKYFSWFPGEALLPSGSQE